MKFNSQFDLKLERIVDLPVELIWEAWTNPLHLKPWFCPKPWTVIDCEIDLRPGGVFKTIMKSPEGHEFPNLGCYLEVIKNQKLTWTDALLPGFRPTSEAKSGAGMLFTASIVLEPIGQQTKYTATCFHKDEQDRIKHEKMGFNEGWSICLDQLVEYMKLQMIKS